MDDDNKETPLWLKAVYYILPIFGTSGLLYLFRYFMKSDMYKKETKIGGKVVLITGINSDIGISTAINLAKRDGKIYIACDDSTRGEEVLKEIKKKSKRDNIHFMNLNLGSLESIRQFSKKFHEMEKKLDILINNHELVAKEKSKTVEGYELHMGVNYLGHFYLTHLLLDLLKSAAPSRIIFESSLAYKWGTINKEDFMSDNSYNRFKAYCNSKLAIHLLVHELAKELSGSLCTVNIAMPGFVISDIVRRITGFSKVQKVLEWMGAKFINTGKEGAQTVIFTAVDTDISTISGKCYVNCKEIQPSSKSTEDETSTWLWKKGEEILGINYV
ncbi:hypothetical protein PVAND_006778 [Polypedilum vanderplanki]|uniref:Uncharacterized protein n=1 Tax=Polypedilum vanderplanki TaxID=319348 RepID=A0A9J6C584_POLVA|nr:hypothetical protein PVAND_006778 [Polypedilum vanderplanki]